MKHYRFRSGNSVEVPSLLFEIKIDLQDMRSGYRYSDWGLFVEGPWIDDLDLEWTADMVHWPDPGDLIETPGKASMTWPELADQKVVRYLTRYYQPRAWKNVSLNLFSNSAETQADFIARCREECCDLREKGLRRVRELFYHRFVELERRLVLKAEQEEPTETWRARRIILIQDAFNDLREHMSRLLLDLNRPIATFPVTPSAEGIGVDGKARFDALWQEFLNKYNEVLIDYETQANQVEPYLVPLSYSQIEIVSRSVLWR